MKHLLYGLAAACAVQAFAQPMSAVADGKGPVPAICEWPELPAAWHAPGRSVAGVQQREASDLASDVGQVLRIQLEPCAAEWCKPGSFAAMVKVHVPKEARYRVAVDQMVWIDVYATSDKLEGLMCEHSGCQPVRKIVQYDFKAGSHWVAVQGRSAGELGVLVIGVGR